MKRYRVQYKNKKDRIIEAYSYTPKGEKYWFHQREDKTDFETFVFASEIQGIDIQPETPPPLGLDLS